jgi:predicted GNAT family N-acyltransferase
MVLSIVPLDSRIHDRANFCCGDADLDRYLQQQASQDIKKNAAAVLILHEPPVPEILGYYSLSAHTVEISELDPTFAKKLPRYPLLPATLLGRLAVAQNQQGKGYGRLMLANALKTARTIATQIASTAVIVDAIDPSAKQFYLKYGFCEFQHHPMKLYLPISAIDLAE